MIYIAIIGLFLLGMLIRSSAKDIIQKLIKDAQEKNNGRN